MRRESMFNKGDFFLEKRGERKTDVGGWRIREYLEAFGAPEKHNKNILYKKFNEN